MAEVKRRKLDDHFNVPNFSFADTLYDVRRVCYKYYQHKNFHFGINYFKQLVKEEHSIFTGWTAQEKKRLGLENLFHKCFPGETYNGNIIHNFKCDSIDLSSSPGIGGCTCNEENFLQQLATSCVVQPDYPKQERYSWLLANLASRKGYFPAVHNPSWKFALKQWLNV